ncbi:7TM GPCR protein [Aphelenchoides avenae]|nr:7TM GPCR protein [Aphelenchus avenae]
MAPPCVPDYLLTLENVAAALGYFFNALLASLVLFRTSRRLRSYSKVLLFNCITDTIFATSSLLVKLHVDIRSGVLFASLHGILERETFAENYTVSTIWIAVTYYTVASTAVPLVYRYFAVCRNRHLGALEVATLIAAVVAGSSFVPLTMELFSRPAGEVITTEMATYADIGTCENRHDIPYFSIVSFSASMMLPLTASSFVVTVSYSVIIVCSYKIWHHVKHSAMMSNRMLAIQSQLNRVLLLQALLPLILNVAPLSATFLVLIFRAEGLGRVIVTTTSVLAWIPALNPLLAICFVKQYRQEILNLFRRTKIGAEVSSTHAVSTRTNTNFERVQP